MPEEPKDGTKSLSQPHVRVTTDSAQSGLRYSKEMRLRRRVEFLHVQNTGTRLYAKQFLILYTPGATARNRLGVVVTRKVDKRAVKRNHIKRRLREVFRLSQLKLLSPFDFVIIARKNAVDCSYAEVERQILGALRYGGLLQ
jgi:ribonuclease P protein component